MNHGKSNRSPIGAILRSALVFSLLLVQGTRFRSVLFTTGRKTPRSIPMATLFSTVNRPEHEMTQGLIPEKRSSRTSVPNASYKKGNSRVSRKSKYSPAKRRLRNSDDFNKSSRSSHIAVGMQDIVNLVREKKRREAMDTLVNLVEEEILHKMMRAESGQQAAAVRSCWCLR